MRRIVVPQALRRVIPPLTNEFVLIIEDASIGPVIGLGEHLRAARVSQPVTAKAAPHALAAPIYLVICLCP